MAAKEWGAIPMLALSVDAWPHWSLPLWGFPGDKADVEIADAATTLLELSDAVTVLVTVGDLATVEVTVSDHGC